MRRLNVYFATVLMTVPVAPGFAQSANHKWAVVVHGGAGAIVRGSQEALYRAGLKDALNAAAGVLSSGGSSLDAVERAVMLLEDNPNFNAGRGAVFTAEGKV